MNEKLNIKIDARNQDLQSKSDFEPVVINFLADKLKNDSEYYQKIKVILRKIIQETMTHYVTQISQKKYLSNIDFHHLPNSCATHILNDFKSDSQKYL